MTKTSSFENLLYQPCHEHDACGIGAVANISGRQDHNILQLGRQILLNLQHRGAAGSDETTGDGAGILFQLPHTFFCEEASRLGQTLPEPDHYGVAMIFLPQSESIRNRCRDILARSIEHYNLKPLFYRPVPTQSDCLGKLAREAEPVTEQLFIDAGPLHGEPLERTLFLARKRAEMFIAMELAEKANDFYIVSMSSRTICYKGMFLAWQLFEYYPDLQDPRLVSALAIVHQRYSTNTFPNWKLAQPFRCIAHNGEINTLSGNTNQIRAREMSMACDMLPDLKDLLPILAPGNSDSACFDNVLELLVRSGRSLPHSIMMMIPEAFGPSYHISTDKRAFYEYHAAIMEPWDGPAAMVFTDGRFLGGTLDRNGLRPARYVITTDGLVVLASEIGVVEFPPEKIQSKGRLRPGRMFLVDTREGRVIRDNEIKSKISRQKPYRRWLEQNRILLRGLFHVTPSKTRDSQEIVRSMKIFGYTREEIKMILSPMGGNAQEPIGSMGTDTPLAVLSDRPQLLYEYFKQSFAQVTNPPIDPLREGLVMSLMSFVGKQRNLLTETPEHCRQLKIPHPILTDEDIHLLLAVQRADFKVATIPALFDAQASDPAVSLKSGLDQMIMAAQKEIEKGASLLIVSDRGVCQTSAPIPALLATAALHHGLLDRNLRGQVGIVLETGEPREVMHFCLLCGFGANAVNPYLAFECLQEARKTGDIAADLEPEQVTENFINACKKGILKTMSRMGISTLRSYHAAQLFEAIGLNRKLIDAYFKNTASRIQGIGLAEIAAETLQRHRRAFTEPAPGEMDIEYGGQYHYRADGCRHLWNPKSVSFLQHAVRNNDLASYKKYAERINNQSRDLYTLRGLFEFRPGTPVPLDQVEPACEIVKRFCTGAMSHGSISKEAHETMAIAMNRLGAMSNTGEGGEDSARYQPGTNGDSLNSQIKQIASGRFGVTLEYLSHAHTLQIKMAQGAKPGEGGQLPGHKVTEEIARLRHSTPGVTLISPPPHHDIYSIEDLAQLIYDLKCSNPGVKVSVKLVSEVGVGTIAAGVAKGHADEILISGHDGGTGASPLSSIRHVGAPWELGLAETQQTLILNNLRDRVKLQADGQMKTGRDIVIAALLGAEHFGFGTAALVSLGCVLLRKCHQDSCTMGIATQRGELRKLFAGKPEHLQNFMLFVAQEVRQIMAQLGFTRFQDLIGRSEHLCPRKAIDHYKAKGLDFSALFARADTSDGRAISNQRDQANLLQDHLDWKLIEQITPSLEKKENVSLQLPIRNVNRTVGTILAHHVFKKYGPQGLPDDTITITFTGNAGQSFGAFLLPGITLRLIGDANDYVAKGLSGGRIIIQTPENVSYDPRKNITAGNTILYGATSGEVFINGLVGERFAVRNSGAIAVVEGVGDHGCEYMTGGTIVVLGTTGRNFAAGMSGGTAYVLDEAQLFDTLCNLDMVDLENVWHQEDIQLLRDLIQKHYDFTASPRAEWILKSWREMVGNFVKVIPIDYRKALRRMKEREQRETEFTPATEEVYQNG